MTPPDGSDHPTDPMEAALAEFHRACVSGNRPDVDAFCEDHPECGPELREKIEDLAFVLAGLPGSESGRAGKPDVEEVPDRIGRFRIIKELGRGGQGTVYLAQDEKLHRQVAIKVLPSVFDLSQHLLQRFRREAEAASRLDHPGICSIYETGEFKGFHYIVMRYVEGESLAKKIAIAREDASRYEAGVFESSGFGGNGPGTPAKGSSTAGQNAVMRSVYCIEKAARAVHAAHEAGIVHRDIKPGNIMVTPDDDPVILDFGLARLEESDGADLTRSIDILGTPAYMSPEQIRGERKRIDRQTDIYSLAVTLLECLTLRPPFEAPTRDGLYHAILTEAPPDPRSSNWRIPSDLNVILQTALAKNPDHRYKTALDFAEELRRVRQHEPILTRRVGPLVRLIRWSQRNPGLAAALGGIFLVLALGLIVTAYLLGETRSLLDQTQIESEEKERFADISFLAYMEQLEEDLWPELPVKVDDMDRWLADAEGLLGRLELHQARLTAMESNPEGVDSDRVRQQRTFVDQLSRFDVVIDEVRRRRHAAATLEELTVDNHRNEWEATVTAIADIEMNPHYQGLKIAPQLGLIPLDQDPDSGLFEFAHIQTGVPPVRDPVTGKLTITEDTGLVFVLLPGGTFKMGSRLPDSDAEFSKGDPNVDPWSTNDNWPPHDVDLDPFFMSKYEMTQGQWLHVTGKNPSNYIPGYKIGDYQTGATLRNPVEMVSWKECTDILCRYGLVLPLETWWEYACRAGSTTVWYTGNDYRSLNGYENLLDRSCIDRVFGVAKEDEFLLENDGHLVHAPVGTFEPNRFGLLDMAGNVQEWCYDGWIRYWDFRLNKLIGVTPGEGLRRPPDTRRLRIARGGHYHSDAWFARSANRPGGLPTKRTNTLGVRPAMKIRQPR